MKRTPTGKIYTVKALSDFTEIPIECFGDYLQDFIEFLALLYAVKKTAEEKKLAIPNDFGHFVWTDDGVSGITEIENMEETSKCTG
jgi:hypothetical protein